MPKPIPQPDEISRPFWESANRRQLVVQRCQACKQYRHPPLVLCTNCQSTDLRFEGVSGRGTIRSYTISHDPRVDSFASLIPFPIAVVELAEQPGLLMLTNLPGAKNDEIKAGLPVKVDFEEIAPGRCIPQFRLTK